VYSATRLIAPSCDPTAPDVRGCCDAAAFVRSLR
jgi:hypothetical protein